MFEQIPDNNVVLLLGNSLDGKKKAMYEYVRSCTKKNELLLFVTTDSSPESIKIELVKDKVFFGKNIRFIDCYSQQANESVGDTEEIRRIPSPMALNEMSIALAEIEKEFYAKSPKHKVIFNSLSTLLLYSNPQAIARFLQVTIARIKNAGGSGIFTIEKGMHDEQVITTITHLMDGVIEFEKKEDKIEVKTKGFGSEKWEVLE